MLVKTYGSAVYGIDAITITVEVNIGRGAKFYLVGLPDNAVKESHQRISAALKNNGYRIPGKEVTVNMAPADIKKEGSSYDCTIAVGILAASGVIENADTLSEYVIMGELSLDGNLRPLKGALPIAYSAAKSGFKGVILPKENMKEASVLKNIKVFGAEHFQEIIDFFNGCGELSTIKEAEIISKNKIDKVKLDFEDVKGQDNVKRAAEISAAGGHNILLIGPPGSGKTMIAKRIPGILPSLTLEEAIETTKIHSVNGSLNKEDGIVTQRPFRSPHHTVSDVALVGGGTNPKPGEISLAHNGILFLDELPEFKRTVLEVLRQPLEDKVVTISRARISVDYPADFMLVAAMNPSPSGGFYSQNEGDSLQTVKRYLSKLSGPLLDRIDLYVEVQKVPFEKLSQKSTGESSLSIRERVEQVRQIQLNRYKDYEGIYCNAQLTPKLMRKYCQLDTVSEMLLKKAVENIGLTARSYDRILKVARTIADMEVQKNIQAEHIAEAIQYRSMDREEWR